MGMPEFPLNSELFNQRDELITNVQVNEFGSGQEQRVSLVSSPRHRFVLTFPGFVNTVHNTLWTFYRQSRLGPLLPFIFTSKYDPLYQQIKFDGTSGLKLNGDDQVRLGTQKFAVRFTNNVNGRHLFGVLAQKVGIGLAQDLNASNIGKNIVFDEGQYATITDADQDLLDPGHHDFMIEFWARTQTIFVSSVASYAAMSGKTLIFTIGSTTYTVTFTATASSAATTASEINTQQGNTVTAEVVNTGELKIISKLSGYFTISGTAFAQLNLSANDIYPIHKHTGTQGYYFKQDGVGDFTFAIESAGVSKTLTADTSFHFADGRWHYIVATIDKNSLGQLYVDGVTSGSAVLVTGIGSLNNTADFFLNKNAPQTIEMDEVRFWDFEPSPLPVDIATQINDHYTNPFIIDDALGLKSRWDFNNENTDDNWSQENLTSVNNPTFTER